MRRLFVLLLVAIYVCSWYSTPVAQAYFASSTNFGLQHQLNSIGGRSTTTNFTVFHAGGQTANTQATTTNFYGLMGILKFLFEPTKPQYEQVHYHWRQDDGSEAAATSATGGTQDTLFASFPELTTKRLRLEISNSGGTRFAYSAQQFRLEYGLLVSTCSAIVSWTDVGAGGGDWDMANSTNLTDGNDTTNIATGIGGVTDTNKTFLTSNAGVKDTSSQVASLSVPSDSFVELEYSVQALAAATDAGTYCFRVTNASSATNYTYTVYPQATIAGGQTLSFSLSDNTIGFGPLSSSAARFATGDTNGDNSEVEAHQLVAATSAASGYVITIKGATLTSGLDTVTAIGGSNTASAVGFEQFGLRMTATGGSGAVTAPYADSGFAYAADASTASQVASVSGSSTATTYSVRYLANITATTEAGSYQGTYTYTISASF